MEVVDDFVPLEAGLKFSDTLFLEDVELEFMNYLIVRNEDQDAQSAQDL